MLREDVKTAVQCLSLNQLQTFLDFDIAGTVPSLCYSIVPLPCFGECKSLFGSTILTLAVIPFTKFEVHPRSRYVADALHSAMMLSSLVEQLYFYLLARESSPSLAGHIF
jgi:hypothetical protein